MSDHVFDEATARALWDESADAWDAFVAGGLDYHREELHGPALLDACGAVAGQDALDLGCGQGWFSRQLAAAGARVIGVDWSPRLIEHARRHGGEVRYEVGDAAEIGARFAPGSFDLISACMSLMDMPRPDRVLAAARALLRPGGRIAVSVPNPLTDAPHRAWKRDANGGKLALEIDRYFEASPGVLEWSMKRLAHTFRTVQYRYTLEQWSRMIEDAGLVITRMREPRPDAAAIARWPQLATAARVPYSLVLVLRSGAVR